MQGLIGEARHTVRVFHFRIKGPDREGKRRPESVAHRGCNPLVIGRPEWIRERASGESAGAAELPQGHRVLPADVVEHAVRSRRLYGDQAGAVGAFGAVMAQHQGVPHPLSLLPAHLGQVKPQVIDAGVRIGLVHQIEGVQFLPAIGAFHQSFVYV